MGTFIPKLMHYAVNQAWQCSDGSECRHVGRSARSAEGPKDPEAKGVLILTDSTRIR